jgi:hypothetical protein
MNTSIFSLSEAAKLEQGGRRTEDSLPQQAPNVLQAGLGTNISRASAQEDLQKNYRRSIQRALRQVKSAEGGFVNADVVSLEGLTCLPCVVLKGMGRVALPLSVEQEGGDVFHMCCNPWQFPSSVLQQR